MCVCLVTIIRWVNVDYDRHFQNPSDFTVFIQMLMNLKRVYGVDKTLRGNMRQTVKLPLQEVVMIKKFERIQNIQEFFYVREIVEIDTVYYVKQRRIY